MLYVHVILPVPIQKLFTYSVPPDMEQQVGVGARVVVQFGKKKSYSAIVCKVGVEKPEGYDVKPIDLVVDPMPIVTERQLQLWQWIAEYYICTLGEVYKAALPSGLKLESESKIVYNPDFEADGILPEKQEQILNYLREKRTATIQELAQWVESFSPLPQIRKLLEAGAVFVSEELRDSYKPKTQKCYSLAPKVRSEEALNAAMDALERAPKQMESFMNFLQLAGGLGSAMNGGSATAEQIKEAGVDPTKMSELVKKGLLELSKLNVSRLQQRSTQLQPPATLSEAQQTALTQIENNFAQNKVTLLNGVTSSGKTEIYIHLINRCISEGKQVLYLLPEIALTTQITQRLERHFGSMMGVYHSKFSDAQRVELWNNLLSANPYKLVLGVRSSVLLPFSNLGLIIVDEEHETSFKQYDPAPRYNARDVAVVLANMYGARILLGSATPSFESYLNAKLGRYGYVELTTRYAGIMLPRMEVVDMKDARKHKTTQGIFSFRLRDAIAKAIDGKEQVILFQNRRGFAPYVECNQCAWTAKCINCDVSMTYHKNTHELVCHYCGAHVQLPQLCPACGNPSLELLGYGTEKIEEEVKSIFPEARIARMDLDTARTRTQFEELIADFAAYKYDVLIGTQMISKGLDFQRVTTVGIMNVDQMLSIPDFRADEHAFQMIQQVSGRAGRHGKQGTVYLQTTHPDSNVVKNALNHDFEQSTAELLDERRKYLYPPYTRLVNITIKHKDYLACERTAMVLANELRKVFGNRILGPQAPSIARIATYFLQRITLKMEKTVNPAEMKQILMQNVNAVMAQPEFKGVIVQTDVDPY